MSKIIYGTGLLVGGWIKVIGWSTMPIVDAPPGKPLIRLQLEMDEFNRDRVESMAAVGMVTEPFIPARICRFSCSKVKAAGHTWLPTSKVKMGSVYENFQEEKLAA